MGCRPPCHSRPIPKGDAFVSVGELVRPVGLLPTPTGEFQGWKMGLGDPPAPEDGVSPIKWEGQGARYPHREVAGDRP